MPRHWMPWMPSLPGLVAAQPYYRDPFRLVAVPYLLHYLRVAFSRYVW